MTSSVLFSNQDAPATPAAGKQLLYANTDNVMYVLDENGVATPVGAQNEFQNVVVVNQASDIPDELTSGGNVVYDVQCVTLDLGLRQFTQSGGTCVIKGESRYASILSSSIASGNLFTINSGRFSMEELQVDAAGADWIIDYSPTTVSTLVLRDFVVLNCKSIAKISNAFVTSLRTVSVVRTSVGGFSWSGTGNNQLNITQMVGFGGSLGWAGTLIDLGAATFDIINISSNSRFISKAGNTTLAGAAGSANLTATGRAIVGSTIFNGTGTPLSGITTQDLQWDFGASVVFTDTLFSKTKNDADSFLSVLQTVTVSSSGVYYAVGGTNWQSDITNRFTENSAGELTYIGLDPIDVEITITSTVEKVGGGADAIAGKIAIDTGSGYVVQDKTLSSTENTQPTSINCHGLFTLSTGDKVQLHVANLDSTANIDVSIANMTIKM